MPVRAAPRDAILEPSAGLPFRSSAMEASPMVATQKSGFAPRPVEKIIGGMPHHLCLVDDLGDVDVLRGLNQLVRNCELQIDNAHFEKEEVHENAHARAHYALTLTNSR